MSSERTFSNKLTHRIAVGVGSSGGGGRGGKERDNGGELHRCLFQSSADRM